MLKGTILVLIIIALPLLYFRRSRDWLLEEIKAFSDFLLLWVLRVTSQFGSELTRDGLSEQRMWRKLRLRDLGGLALRSKQKQEHERR
ncbi:MAG: hypothetical protein HYY46_09145 [Deltaproteobacteria bacterium]|nr:hypothetical protein [Deltaproteobacteria bacterium]